MQLIRELLSISCWRLVSSHLSPSVIVSRGFLSNNLVKNEYWFKGPIFLTLPESSWPHFTIGDKFTFDINKEEAKWKINSVYNKDSNACIHNIAVHTILNNHEKMNKNSPVSDGYIKEKSFTVFLHGKLRDSVDISKFIAAEQFSNILKLFHVTLYVFKALWRFKSFIKNKAVTKTITGNRVEQGYYMKLNWVKVVQKLLQLLNNSLFQLNVFVDNDGLLRCGGRIINAKSILNSKIRLPYGIRGYICTCSSVT